MLPVPLGDGYTDNKVVALILGVQPQEKKLSKSIVWRAIQALMGDEHKALMDFVSITDESSPCWQQGVTEKAMQEF